MEIVLLDIFSLYLQIYRFSIEELSLKRLRISENRYLPGHPTFTSNIWCSYVYKNLRPESCLFEVISITLLLVHSITVVVQYSIEKRILFICERNRGNIISNNE